MYKIRCLTNGTLIKINTELIWSLKYKMPDEVFNDILFDNVDTRNMWSLLAEPEKKWFYLQFKTEASAKWMLGHRLTYNSRRKDPDKLEFMEALFELNDIQGFKTSKYEFEVFEE